MVIDAKKLISKSAAHSPCGRSLAFFPFSHYVNSSVDVSKNCRWGTIIKYMRSRLEVRVK